MALVSLDARIETIIPLCGEHLCGTFVVGGSSGPRAVISMSVSRTVEWAIPVGGQASVGAPTLGISRGLAALIAGQASVASPLNQILGLAALVEGRAKLALDILLPWLVATTPVDLVLAATAEEVVTINPTAAASWALAATEEESQTIPATTVEERILVPAGVRNQD